MVSFSVALFALIPILVFTEVHTQTQPTFEQNPRKTIAAKTITKSKIDNTFDFWRAFASHGEKNPQVGPARQIKKNQRTWRACIRKFDSRLCRMSPTCIVMVHALCDGHIWHLGILSQQLAPSSVLKYEDPNALPH